MQTRTQTPGKGPKIDFQRARLYSIHSTPKRAGKAIASAQMQHARRAYFFTLQALKFARSDAKTRLHIHSKFVYNCMYFGTEVRLNYMRIGQSWSDGQARSGGGFSPVFRPYLHHSSQPPPIVLPPWFHPASPPAPSSAEAALSLPAHLAAPEAVTIRHTFHSAGCPRGRGGGTLGRSSVPQSAGDARTFWIVRTSPRRKASMLPMSRHSIGKPCRRMSFGFFPRQAGNLRASASPQKNLNPNFRRRADLLFWRFRSGKGGYLKCISLAYFARFGHA